MPSKATSRILSSSQRTNLPKNASCLRFGEEVSIAIGESSFFRKTICRVDDRERFANFWRSVPAGLISIGTTLLGRILGCRERALDSG
jgi:hypothetical protein